MRLQGNVVIITGGNGGIGEGIAVKCAEEGANVVIVDKDMSKSDAVQARLRAFSGEPMAIQADLCNEDEIKGFVDQVVKKFGRIDTLVNNAGIFGNTKDIPKFAKPFEDITVDEWDIMMKINVRAVFLCCKHVAPVMKAQKKGSIINVSSSTAWKGAPMFLHYGASKGAVMTMTKGLAISLAPFNVRVNTLCPGQVLTESSRSMKNNFAEVEAQMLNKQLLQTPTRPEDMGGLAVYLASDESRMMTGQAIAVNGGEFLH